MICNFCNRQIDDSAKFCVHCGKSVPPISQQPVTANVTQTLNAQEEERKKTTNLIVWVICLVAVILITIVIGVGIISRKQAGQAVPSPMPQPQQQAVAVQPTPTPQPVFNRVETYSRNYSYKKMATIHASAPASDAECFELQGFIVTYNDLWTKLVNERDYSIFAYLRPDTTAHSYATKYSQTNITEEFELIEVNDVRKAGSTYYVWVHEKIKEFHPGETKYLEYHWVYKVGRDGEGLYVEDYTHDPFYSN